ncbi:DUF4870 domain-containing protein [Candidatus Micrarchaeota archaeon]|nr:DUF4870 domain-containing protein [Candidatus Micrarchaeota archaeon]
MAKSSANESNLLGAIAYLLGIITGLILYLMKPEDKYVKYHAMQSMLLTIAIIIIEVVWGVIAGVLTLGTLGLGLLIVAPLTMLLGLVFFVLWLYCMWQAFNGKKFKLPVIGEYAEQYAK